MLHEFRTLVVHDDHKFARDVAEHLRRAFPEMVVVTTDESGAYGFDFDVFVVDCGSHGPDEVRLLHAEAPEALFLGFADGLDREALRAFVNAGVAGLYESTSAEDRDQLFGRIRAFVTRSSESPNTSGVLGAMRSMADLVRQWNRRLDRLEAS